MNDNFKDVYLSMGKSKVTSVIKEEKTPKMSEEAEGVFEDLLKEIIQDETDSKEKAQLVADEYHMIMKMVDDHGKTVLKFMEETFNIICSDEKYEDLCDDAANIASQLGDARAKKAGDILESLIKAFSSGDKKEIYNVARRGARFYNGFTLSELRKVNKFDLECAKTMTKLIKDKRIGD